LFVYTVYEFLNIFLYTAVFLFYLEISETSFAFSCLMVGDTVA